MSSCAFSRNSITYIVHINLKFRPVYPRLSSFQSPKNVLAIAMGKYDFWYKLPSLERSFPFQRHIIAMPHNTSYNKP